MQFCKEAHRRIILTKNPDYFQIIKAFLEQVYIFKDNISQALVNERQIKETIYQKMLMVGQPNVSSVDQVLRQKAMLRPIYSKFNEIVNCSGVATGQVNVDREA